MTSNFFVPLCFLLQNNLLNAPPFISTLWKNNNFVHPWNLNNFLSAHQLEKLCNNSCPQIITCADLQKVASTQAVLGDTKTPQVPAGDTFWLAWINFLGLVTHIIIRDEKIKGICTCFHHIYTIMCLVHQIGLLCMVFVFWYQIMSRITLFFGQIFVANHAVLVTHFDP